MKKYILLFISLMLIVVSCNSGYETTSVESSKMDFGGNAEMLPITRQDADMPTSPAEPIMGQMLIKNIYLSIEVESYEATRPMIDSLTRVHKAWVASENFNNYDQSISNDIEIRVPAELLDKLKDEFLGIAKKVNYQRVESSDVTEEFIDVESRLKNLKKVEDTFVKLLRKTDSIDDVLKIETKLSEVRGNIESMEGRMKYLKNRVQYSTIHLNVFQKVDYKYIPETGERFFERFKKALHNGWKGLIDFILFVFTLWPLYIIVGVTGFLIAYFRKKKPAEPVKLSKKEKEKEKKRLKKQQQQAEKVDADNSNAEQRG